MKIVLIYLFGAATSSSWWAAATWPHLNDEVLWTIPSVFTIATIIGMFYIADKEKY